MQAIETCRTPALGGSVRMVWPLPIQSRPLPLLPQSPLPQAPRLGARPVASEAHRRVTSGRILSRSLHRAQGDCLLSLSITRKPFTISFFRAAAETLLTIARDPKHLGAAIGFFAVLHTWGQNLHLHPHLHCVVPGGGLSATDASAGWHAVRASFFQYACSAACFAAFCSRRCSRPTPPDNSTLRRSGTFKRARGLSPLSGSARQKRMGRLCQATLRRPRQVLEYLGRYTHRVAISNERYSSSNRAMFVSDGKHGRHPQRPKVTTLSAGEFIRHFLLHMRRGFQRIRYFGFLANCHRAGKLELCRQLLANPRAMDLLPRAADLRDFDRTFPAGNPQLSVRDVAECWPSSRHGCHAMARFRCA